MHRKPEHTHSVYLRGDIIAKQQEGGVELIFPCTQPIPPELLESIRDKVTQTQIGSIATDTVMHTLHVEANLSLVREALG